MVKVICSMMVVAVLADSVADELSDDKVKAMIVGSSQYIDNGQLARRLFYHAKDSCGTDTNRFARLLCELAQTNDVWISRQLISHLGWHGTSAQLPFLYSMTTNAHLGATAMRSVLRIEGLTERSVSAASNFLFRTSMGCRPRYEVCKCLLECVQNQGSIHPLRDRSLEVAVSFMSSQNLYHDWLDAGLIRTDPSFRCSKRRLRALRAIAVRETDLRDLAYVTNAIAELVAYPESDLPE